MGINIILNRRPFATQREQLPNNTPYNKRYGFWGVVTEVHPENCTVHVRMDTGVEVSNIRVASMEWVTIDKDKGFLSGERHLPPINTFVYCMMPTGELSSAFVLCSSFIQNSAEHSAFMKKGADAAATWERLDNSGWHSITDYRTGSVTITNKQQDATIRFNVDQETAGEEFITLSIHDNIITVNKNGMDFKTNGKIDIHIDGDATVKVGGNATTTIIGDANIEANKANIKSTETTLTGGKVIIGGTVTPTGTGALCGIPFCAYTGAPHIGDTTEGA